MISSGFARTLLERISFTLRADVPDSVSWRSFAAALLVPACVLVVLAILNVIFYPGYSLVLLITTIAMFIVAAALLLVVRAPLTRFVDERPLRYPRALAVAGTVWLGATVLLPPVGLLVGELAWQAIRLFVSATDSGSGGGGFTFDVYLTTLLFGLPTLVVSLVCCPLLLTWCARRRSGRMNNV